ncbi:MAG TPA: ATP-binding protein [Acidobacteriaceae bacterium]|nr:ATP-binding protein [Acidobacteriaceae bacterium]
MTDSPVGLHEFNRVVRITLLVPVTVLALLAGLLVWQVEQALELRQHSIVNTRVSDQLLALEQRVIDQETSLRAYQLTGLPSQLVPYNGAEPEIEATLTQMRNLPAVSGISDSDVNKLEKDIRTWQSWANGVLEQPAPAPEAVTAALTQQGEGIMDGVRQDFRSALGAAAHERDFYDTKLNQKVSRFLQFVLIMALAAGITIGIFASSRLQRVSSAYELALQELQERNAKLTASQQLLATTLESIGDAVISLSEQGQVRFMNAVAQKLTGWSLNAATNHSIGEVLRLVHPQTRQPMGDLLEDLDHTGAMGLHQEGTLVAQDGSEYAVDAKVSTVVDADGRSDGSVVVFRDVTELRKAEVTLIANEKLAVTGRLAASIAHEIHNPLDSVANLHFLISQETDPQRRSDYLKLAQQELGRTLQISRAMLSLYRESPMPVQVNLEELIGSVLLLLDRKMRDQNIRVEQSFTHPVHVFGFPGELRQVFTNLIANAGEAAGPNGHVRILVRPASPLDGRAGTIVEIADSGRGIAPHVEKKLFQPFMTTKGERGTGLGLWVSLGIVQKHGGTVRISNSTEGDLRGAVVRVYLPERSAQAKDEEDHDAPLIAPPFESAEEWAVRPFSV